MDNVFLLLLIVGVLGIPVSLIFSVIRFLQKKKVKPSLMCAGGLFVLCIISFIGFGVTYKTSGKSTQGQEVLNSAESISVTSDTSNETISEKLPTSTEIEASTENETSTEALPSTEEETTIAPTEDALFATKICESGLVSQDVAEGAYAILKNDMGFEKISVTGTNKVGNTNFDIKADNYNLMITVSDQIYRVICGDYTLYSDGAVKLTKQDLEDRKIGNNGASYYAIAKEIVSSNLKNPTSAKFASMENCQMARKGDLVAVKGYVDATNSFNAKTRNEFVVEFNVLDLAAFSYKTVYININGESSGKYIDIK
jgi:hypothetical protein